MSNSRHLTERFWLPWKFIRAISLNLQGKVTKQAITVDQAHKQEPDTACLSVTQKSKRSTSQVKKLICSLKRSAAREVHANNKWSCHAALAIGNITSESGLFILLKTSTLMLKLSNTAQTILNVGGLGISYVQDLGMNTNGDNKWKIYLV